MVKLLGKDEKHHLELVTSKMVLTVKQVTQSMPKHPHNDYKFMTCPLG